MKSEEGHLIDTLTEKVNALTASGERYRRLVATAPTLVLYLSSQYRILEFNAEAERLLGRKRSDVLGEDFFQLLVPEDEWGTVLDHFQRALVGESSRRFETSICAGEGRKSFVSWNVSRGQGQPGQPDGIIAIGVDITEQKLAEEALRQSNQTLQAIFDAAPVAVLAFDLEGRITHWSAGAQRIFGWTEAEALGRVCPTVPESGMADFREMITRVARYGAENLVRLRQKKSGDRIHAKLNPAPLRDYDGKVSGVMVILEDVTEKHRAEQALASSERRFATLFRASPMAIGYGYVEDDRLIDVNDKYAQMFGYSREEMVGRTAAELNLWVDVEERKRCLQSLLSNSRIENVETRFRRKSGEEFVALLFMERLSLDDESVLIAMPVDVTDWKNAQRKIAAHARQQAAVAELGQRTLTGVPLTVLFNRTVVVVARALEVDFCKVLELLPDKSGLKVVAGVGWREGVAGREVVGAGLDSQAGYTLQNEGPVVVEDLRRETRFKGTSLLHDHGIVSGVTVIIGSAANPWGVLGAHVSQERRFTADDIAFVQSVANVLGAAIANAKAEQSLIDLSGRLLHVEDSERRRIAKDLHDSTAQDLVAVMLNLESLRDVAAARNSPETIQLEDSIALVEKATHEIRTLSYVLHPPRLQEAGLIGAIRHYAVGFGERTGIAMSIDLPEDLERLGESVEIVLVRVVQECLGNLHRHAGSRTAFIRLKHEASNILLEVRDQGRGIPPSTLSTMPGPCPGLGVGIPGMRERLRFIGGKLEIDSSPSGTTVRATVPLSRKMQA